MSSIAFTIPGKVTSANRVTRHVGNRSIKSASARADTERIRELAFAAKVRAGWVVPEVAAVTIVCWNSLLDADNAAKTVLDSIKAGLLIVDDRPRHLRRLVIAHARDELGERYEITVAAHEEGPLR